MLWDIETTGRVRGREQAWPLQGRDAELREVRDAHARPDAGGVVLVGPDGCGRTRLAREALGALAAAGAATAWVAATRSAASLPFGALAQLAGDDAAPATSLADARALVLQAALPGSGRLVLAVDDAHLLDDATAALLLQLALGETAFVLATVPAGARPPDPVRALWKDAGAPRVELDHLTEAAVGLVVEDALGGPVDGGTRHRLAHLTGGSPMLLRALVEHAETTGTLAWGDGVWSARAELEPGRALRELVEARLDALDETERRALELVAVAGELDLRNFEVLAGPRAAGTLERRGLVTVRRDGRRSAVLAHPPLGAAVLRETVPAVVARSCARELAAQLQRCGSRRREDVRALGRLALEGVVCPGADVLLRASRDAARQGRPARAERLAGAALDAGAGLSATAALAAALAAQRRFPEVEALLAPHERDVLRAPLPDALPYLVWRAASLRRAGETGAARALLDRCARRRSDRGWPACVTAVAALLDLEEGACEAALDQASAVLGDARAEPSAVALAARVAALASMLLGRPAAVAGPTPIGQATRLALDGRPVEADDLLAQAYEDALARADDHERAELCLVRGWIALIAASAVTARRWLGEAATLLRDADPWDELPCCLALTAVAAAQSGALDDAGRAIEEAAGFPGGGGIALLAEAWVAAGGGERSRARHLASAAADSEHGRPLVRAFLLHESLRLGSSPSHVAPALAELAAAGESAVVQALAVHAAAAGAGGRALEAAARRFEDLGLPLHAAEAWCDAATAQDRSGRDSAARRLRTHAIALLGRCEAVRTPALDGLADTPCALTSREREVAELAASGLTNADIADRLVVSVRTVESHLYAVFAKLRIDRRERLAALLAPPRAAAGPGPAAA